LLCTGQKMTLPASKADRCDANPKCHCDRHPETHTDYFRYVRYRQATLRKILLLLMATKQEATGQGLMKHRVMCAQPIVSSQGLRAYIHNYFRSSSRSSKSEIFLKATPLSLTYRR